MKICAECKNVWFSIAPGGPICLLTKGKQNPVNGSYYYKNCSDINKDGKCKNYEKSVTFWQKVKEYLFGSN